MTPPGEAEGFALAERHVSTTSIILDLWLEIHAKHHIRDALESALTTCRAAHGARWSSRMTRGENPVFSIWSREISQCFAQSIFPPFPLQHSMPNRHSVPPTLIRLSIPSPHATSHTIYPLGGAIVTLLFRYTCTLSCSVSTLKATITVISTANSLRPIHRKHPKSSPSIPQTQPPQSTNTN